MRLARVLEHGDSPLAREGEDRGHVRGVAVEVDGQDGLRARGDRAGEALRVEVQGAGVHVHEDGAGARLQHGEAGEGGRDRGGDHLVAGAHTERAQGERERVGAVPDRHRVPRAERLGQLALEGLPLGAQDEPAGVEDPRHRLVQLAPVGGHVGPEVHEGDGEGSAHR